MTLEDMYRLLGSGHIQTQGIVDTIQAPLVVLDADYRIVGANKAFFSDFLMTRGEMMGVSLFAVDEGRWDIPELRRLLSEVIPKSAAIVGYEIETELSRTGKRLISLSARRLSHPDDNSTSLLLQFDDITDTRHADTARDMLLEETRHRMRNLLAMISSLAQQTRTRDRTAEEYRDALLGRLKAMLESQDWAGDKDRIAGDLETTIRRMLDGHGETARLRLQPGPAVTLAADQVLSLNLILHELVTNATKYGALSAGDGWVTVGWTVEDGARLKLVWHEAGGPRTGPPVREGFGTRLIQFSARGNLGGGAELDYQADGLVARITATLRN